MQINVINPALTNNKVSNARIINYVSFSGDKKDEFKPSRDPDIQELDRLAREYRRSGKLEDKHKLFLQEAKILAQELTEPEKYLERAKRMGAMENIPPNLEDQKKQLQINALYGYMAYLNTMENLKQPIKYDDKVIHELGNLLKNTPEDTRLNQQLKIYAMECLFCLYKELSPEVKDKFNDILIDNFQNSKISDCKDYAFSILRSGKNKDKPFYGELKDYAYKQWNSKDSTLLEKRSALVSLYKIKAPELKEIITDIIRDKEADTSLKLAAIWCAGRIQNDNHFELLTDIIYSKTSENPKEKIQDEDLKEMALSSLALYTKKKPDEVKKAITIIANSDSILKDPAQVLLKKVQGKGYVKDEIIEENIDIEKGRIQYKRLRDRYIKGVNELNTKERNFVDKGLVPLVGSLEKLVRKGSQVNILNDTITGRFKESIARRRGDGRFADFVTGTAKGKNIAISKWHFEEPGNVVAHEFNHAFLFNVLDYKDRIKIKQLYNKAKTTDSFMDYYSARNHKEYFAKGYEAYVTDYLSHIYMICNGNYYDAINTKVSLKHKDPELFEFIEHCNKKYNSPEQNSNTNKSNGINGNIFKALFKK